MKKLLFCLLFSTLGFISCQKDELTVDELLNCSEERDNKIVQITQLYLNKAISTIEYNRRIDGVEEEYQDCLEEGRNN